MMFNDDIKKNLEQVIGSNSADVLQSEAKNAEIMKNISNAVYTLHEEYVLQRMLHL